MRRSLFFTYASLTARSLSTVVTPQCKPIASMCITAHRVPKFTSCRTYDKAITNMFVNILSFAPAQGCTRTTYVSFISGRGGGC